jgi:hypothetical protein
MKCVTALLPPISITQHCSHLQQLDCQAVAPLQLPGAPHSPACAPCMRTPTHCSCHALYTKFVPTLLAPPPPILFTHYRSHLQHHDCQAVALPLPPCGPRSPACAPCTNTPTRCSCHALHVKCVAALLAAPISISQYRSHLQHLQCQATAPLQLSGEPHNSPAYSKHAPRTHTSRHCHCHALYVYTKCATALLAPPPHHHITARTCSSLYVKQ